MSEQERTRHWANLALHRLWPRIDAEFRTAASAAPADWQTFAGRVRHEWPRLFALLLQIYGNNHDFYYHLERLLAAAAQSWLDRPAWLKARDAAREATPTWFQSQHLVGGVVYVDRFAQTLAGVQAHIPYLKELGLGYLHLMPLFAAPAGDSDGGYAVSSYRDVNPALGNFDELRALAEALHREGISLVIDFVFNHTADEHIWARQAQAGDPEYEAFYHIFPDRTLPDQYQRTLREIFPSVRRGSFIFREDMGKWVWTTFNNFQWDLNYANPAVFRAMGEEFLYLANAGVEFLRLDAVAFIWKQIGTDCENRPEAHLLIQAFNALARIAAPSLLFKSEAIVHPDEVLRYISPQECQISYNPLLMALLWETLATREVRLLATSMHKRFALPAGTAWVNYLRSHDDIGWTFDDDDARRVGIDPYGHRRFLNMFYVGRYQPSFACGVPFQENPDTGDARVSGTLASLAGLEQALQLGDAILIELAIRRILLLHGIILSIGGVPLIYLGDEIGTLNDYRFVEEPSLAGDSRWVHRPLFDWARAERRHDLQTVEGRIYSGLRRLISLRQSQPVLAGGELEVIESGNPHLFGYLRSHGGGRLLVLANFAEAPQVIDGNRLRVYGLGYQFVDLISDTSRATEAGLTLEPYELLWLVRG